MAAEHSGLMSMLGAVGGAIGTLAAAVGGWMFKRIIAKHDEEMAALKKGMSDMKDALANDYVRQETYEQNRREMRDGIIDLHRKVESTAQVLTEKMDSERLAAEQRHNQLVTILLQRGNGER